MSRRHLGAVMLVVLVALVGFSAWSWWRRWSAPLIPIVLRPAFSVQGIDTGTPVRINGVVVGQVASIGLGFDAQQQLCPEVNLTLDLTTMEDRGLASRLKTQDFTAEVQQGLRGRLVAVSPSSGLLQVELLWDKSSPLPKNLTPHEVPIFDGGLRQTMERAVLGLKKVNQRDLAKVAEEMNRDLDYYYPRSDPAIARELNHTWVSKTESLVQATSAEQLGAKAQHLYDACQSLRVTVDRWDQKLDGTTLEQVQTKLHEAQAALDSFHEALAALDPKMQSAQGDISQALHSVSDFARLLTDRAKGLTTEPEPPAR